MTGFNLPPGCNVSDIPGNRPEDLDEEFFWDSLEDNMEKNHPVLKRVIDRLFESEENFVGGIMIEDAVVALIAEARVIAYDQGYKDGRQEESLYNSWKEEDEQ